MPNNEYYILKGMISELSEDTQTCINMRAEDIRQLSNDEIGVMALTLVALELQE